MGDRRWVIKGPSSRLPWSRFPNRFGTPLLAWYPLPPTCAGIWLGTFREALEHPWKDKVFYVEWRAKDQSNVKVYDQKRTVEYADFKVGLFYISPFDLFVKEEAAITKVEKKKSKSVKE